MDKNQLKELVKSHFNLVEAPETPTETPEVFGEIADENKAFIIKFPGDKMEVGSPVLVITEEGQEAPVPNGYHKLEDGKTIKVEDGVITEIEDTKTEAAEEELEAETKEEMSAEEATEEVVEETTEEVVEDATEEVVEETATTEDVVNEVMSAIKAELDAVKAELNEVKEAFAKVSAEPASSKTLPLPKEETSHKFDIESAANADRIKQTIEQLKNKNKK